MCWSFQMVYSANSNISIAVPQANNTHTRIILYVIAIKYPMASRKNYQKTTTTFRQLAAPRAAGRARLHVIVIVISIGWLSHTPPHQDRESRTANRVPCVCYVCTDLAGNQRQQSVTHRRPYAKTQILFRQESYSVSTSHRVVERTTPKNENHIYNKYIHMYIYEYCIFVIRSKRNCLILSQIFYVFN